MNFRALMPLLLLAGPAAAQAGEWMSCASKTHSLELLVEPAQNRVLGFALFIHGERQDAVSWDIVTGTLDPRRRTLTLTARERSTAPREFTLTVEDTFGRLRLRGGGEALHDLSCFWGMIGG